jgi:hypothetical protein
MFLIQYVGPLNLENLILICELKLDLLVNNRSLLFPKKLQQSAINLKDAAFYITCSWDFLLKRGRFEQSSYK